MRPAFHRFRDRGEGLEQEDRYDGYSEYRSSVHSRNYKLPHSGTATEIPCPRRGGLGVAGPFLTGSLPPYFACFFGSFAFSVLAFGLFVFPGGTQPHPQFSFLANRITPSPTGLRLVSLSPPARAGTRRCTAWRNPAAGGTPGRSSPPS